MLNQLVQFGIFLLQAIVIVVAILVIVAGIAAIISRAKSKIKGKIQIKKLNDYYDELEKSLNKKILKKHDYKHFIKEKKAIKKHKKSLKKRLFVMKFQGDIKASGVEGLRQEITSILKVAKPNDEVILCLESTGGTVHGYGLAASQLQRIRDRAIFLTIAVDKVAASGGYMMACVANKILAAPFAIIGSIGVLAQLPNFSKLLKKHNIDFEQIKAGQYKRTLSVFGENTEEGREKLQQEINETHELFKNFVKKHRSKVDIEKLATGEHWYGKQAIDLKLVDELITSDDYLLQQSKQAQIFEIQYQIKKTWKQHLGLFLMNYL